MHRLNILAIHRDPLILATVLRLINTNEKWNGIGAITDEEAVEMFHQQPVGIVLFCAGIDPESEEKLKAVFNTQNPPPIFLQHYGGGSGLLSAEIYEALAKQGH
ncbi:MAG: response regulator receiver protein [Sphingobacteriaceae bacterium]|nr:MAG: response regulator receiver protein [Sphingobacteriaceae bacterium]